MPHKFLNNHLRIIEQNISYYNDIAVQYNSMLDKNSDKAVRQKVANRFCSIVQNAVVLDLGGGTGLDLKWLAENNHQIFFCEPSNAMREIAISTHGNLLNKNITFLDDLAVDFRHWNTRPPFTEKVDAALANFAVINCIPDIELLFQSLSPFIKYGGNIIALILTKNLKRRLTSNFKSALRSIIFNEPLSINMQYQNHQQTVYIYSIKEIIKASENNFILYTSESITGSDFTLIHLKRK